MSGDDLFIDYNKFNTDTMIYIKPVLFYKVTRNMGIYYKKAIGDGETKNQKIIIRTPKMIVPFDIKLFENKETNKKKFKACLSFYAMTNLYNEVEIKNFYSFVKKIDAINEEIVLDHKEAWSLPKKMKYKKTLQRLSTDFPYHMEINLPYDDDNSKFLFNVYDESAKESAIDIIKKKSIVSMVLELTDLRFNDSDYKANWTVMQIRKFKPYSPIQEFFMTGCYICDQDNPEDTAYDIIIENYKKKLSKKIPLPIIPQLNYVMPQTTTENTLSPQLHATEPQPILQKSSNPPPGPGRKPPNL